MEKKVIFASMEKMLKKLSLDTAESKHMLALFRRSASSGIDEPECLGWMFSNIEPELQGSYGYLSKEEKAIFLGLCTYAVSRGKSVSDVSMVTAMKRAGIGREKLERVELALTFDGIKMPFFLLTKYIVSKGQNFNYASLALDLYEIQFDWMKVVRKWEREYAKQEDIQ